MHTDSKNIHAPDRRRFLKQAASAGLVAGVGPWLASCGGSDNGAAATPAKTELRTMYFDLSNANTQADYYLVAGTRHHALSPVTPDQLAAARVANPMLKQVSDGQITHVANAVPMSAKGIQMCFVKGVSRAANTPTGSWSMHHMFYHVPSATSVNVGQALARSCDKEASGASLKTAFSTCVSPAVNAVQPHVLASIDYSYCTDARYDNYKDYFDHAVALVCHHPEVGSFDAATLSYVQQKIVCSDANILALAVSLYKQGPATVNGGWATLQEFLDPDTGLPKLGSNGDKLYFAKHSDETLRLTGVAIRSVLPRIKNDPVLGVNITGLSPTTTNAAVQGKMWSIKNGTPTKTAPSPLLNASSRALLSTSTATWTNTEASGMAGYSVDSVSDDGNRTVSFTVHNNYIRYLGLYIRYLDGAGKPIPYASLPTDTQSQFTHTLCKEADCFRSLINQELAIFGIPIQQDSQDFHVKVPDMAASFQILAGGLGRGSNDYPNTVVPGTAMTVVLDIAVPGLFLAMSATAAYGTFSAQMSASTGLLVSTAQVFMQTITDSALVGIYGDPATFKNLLMPVAGTLLKSASGLYTLVTESLVEGEAEGIAEDCIPFGIGLIFQAIQALGTLAQIAETSAEVANSPWTFVTNVVATHNLTVTINHDPLDVAGFPAVATHYRLIAVCDGGSPHDSGEIAMPQTTQTAPLSYTFTDLPAGGKVTVTVSFYSQSGWLAGAGSSGAVDNTQDAATITITEILVPLNSGTRYGHKQKIVLDASGHHVWQASQTAPTVQPLNCNNDNGHLCTLAGITLSEPFGAIGYAWQSTSAGVTDFATGATGQLYQFANLSFTASPQQGYMFSVKGFHTPARLAYNRSSATSQNFYIDTSNDKNMVRRITMTAVDTPPVIDLPDSKLAVGQFNFASDAFLVHPTGKLISINTEFNKLEVLIPSGTAVADTAAPQAQAYSGVGTREGLIKGPACMAITPKGAILVLEQGNNRIQAFDTGANPTKIFANDSSSTMPLHTPNSGTTYLDLAMEFLGYIYVLSVNASDVYALDIYKPTGEWLCTTQGVNAGKLTLDLFRNVYTLNYETLTPIGSVTEPSISQWIPSVMLGWSRGPAAL